MTAKATKKSTEVATVSTSHAALVAAFGDEDYSDSIQVEYSTFPTLKLIQKTSAECDEGLARPGQFFHNILKVPVEEPLTLVPLMVRTTYVIWKPVSEGGGIIARSTDGKSWDKPNSTFSLVIDGSPRQFNTKANVKASKLAEWGSSVPGNPNSKPVADMSIVIFAILKDHPEYGPFRVLLRSSALKDTNKFIQLLGQKRTIMNNGQVMHLPPFAFQFDLTSVKKSEGSKTWYIPAFAGLEPLDVQGADKDFVNAMRDVYLMHKSQFDSMAVMDSDSDSEQPEIPEGTEF